MIPKLEALVIRCRAQEQQAHMYREIAVKFSQEIEQLRHLIEHDQSAYQKALDEEAARTNQQATRAVQLQDEVARLKASISALGTPRTRQAPILPFTPSVRRTQRDPSPCNTNDGHTSRFVAATPLTT